MCHLAHTSLAILAILSALATTAAAAPTPLALYDFSEPEGATVHDRSGHGDPLDLTIADPTKVRRADASLQLTGPTSLRSQKPASKLSDAIRQSRALTIEAWITPANTSQDGPARIVTLSKDTSNRNATLGQDRSSLNGRVRSRDAGPNGSPGITSPDRSLAPQLTHAVLTRATDGSTRLFIDGQQAAQSSAAGDLDSWDASFHLALGQELSDERPWLGTYHLVAIYAEALDPASIARLFEEGPGSASRIAQTAAPTPAVTAQPAPQPAPQPAANSGRSHDGLLALYDFSEPEGATVHDRSGHGDPLDLTIADPTKVRRADASLQLTGPTSLRSQKPASKLSDAIRQSRALTIEAWITPANTSQDGPARIVTLSKDTSNRNATLGQDRSSLNGRVRSRDAGPNGSPGITSPDRSLAPQLTHAVLTRATDGSTRLFIDGQQAAQSSAGGDLDSWDASFHLALGQELNDERPWLGTYHLVAIYGRALDPQEIARHFQLGKDPFDPAAALERQRAEGERLFRSHIAPILVRNCFECHDSATAEGGLDLARREAALKGGTAGPAIVPGDPEASELWHSVDSAEMPKDRAPLSQEERELIQHWIATGAHWPDETVDAAIYTFRRDASQLWVRRLTVPEYIETIRATTGVDIAELARASLPRDIRADGFSNTAYNLTVDLGHIEAYADLAARVVAQMDIPALAARFTSSTELSQDNVRRLVDGLGLHFLRRPLDQEDAPRYLALAQAVEDLGGDFYEAVEIITEAMLQAPRFLYLIEKQAGDGAPRLLDAYELASRLSYIAWGAPPDADLYQAAAAGDLLDDAGLARQVARLLQDPRAQARSLTFAEEWLALGRLDSLNPDPTRFPLWQQGLAEDMKAETLALFQHVVWDQRAPLARLFDAQFTFATPRLARYYGLEPAGQALQRYDLSSVPSRQGMLTHASLLTAGGETASMVARGLFLLHDFLRGVIANPPPGTDTTPVPAAPGASNRTAAEARIADRNCTACHAKFEPLAFAFERYDGYGAYQLADAFGNPLRQDGQILIPGSAEPQDFATTAELVEIIAKEDRVLQTITWKLAQFALGRPLLAEDAASVEQAHAAAMEAGGTYQSTLAALLLSDLVRTTRTETPTP